jgi:chromosome segregation ATPase
MPSVNPLPPQRGTVGPPADLDLDNLENFDEEFERLSNASRELLASLRGPTLREDPAPADPEEAAFLRLENAELRARVEELEHALQGPEAGEDVWVERQREYEALLEEKSEVIRTLHQKIRDLQERAPARPAAPLAEAPDADEMRQLQLELEEQRRQLQEDEEAMTGQLRDMEMSLSKDRADLARQRQEVQRMQTELARELEQAGRDPGLRERLLALRRQNENVKAPTTPLPGVPTEAAMATAKKNSSGMFRRFFG